MQIKADFCRLWECSSNPDNCGFVKKDCAMKAMYVALDKCITKTTKYSHMGISQSLSSHDIKEAVKLLDIIERMNK